MPAWDKIEQLAKHFEDMFNATGEPIEGALDQKYNWHNKLWSSLGYRRAHVQVVDNRDTHGIYILHTTVFPQVNDPSPIFGFDAVCGKNKITGAFHDFSNGGDPKSFMYLWFKAKTAQVEWNKTRELPEWARMIFSPAMVAAGNLQEDAKIDQLCELAKTSLDFYLANVGKDQQDVASYEMAQNRYCHWQKQNPHVVRSMVSMGVPEPTMIQFVNEVLFPELA
jgi:Ferredoxin-dependent bilin reductase